MKDQEQKIWKLRARQTKVIERLRGAEFANGRLRAENARLRAALEYIEKIGCMQRKSEEEFFCKYDDSAHSCYCPRGIARAALRGAK